MSTELDEEITEADSQTPWARDDVEVIRCEHGGKKLFGTVFHRERMRGHAVLLSGINGFFYITDSICALVTIIVARTTIRDKNRDATLGGTLEE